MRLAYFGTSGFAVPALRALAESVVVVVTQPDRPAGRRQELRPSPVKLAGQELSLPLQAPPKVRDPDFIASVRSLDLDALVVASYGQILPEALLGAAKRGGINLHASILPKYRGAAPIQRAILAGETETGVTLMQMDKGMDTGDIIAIERTRIGPTEAAGELEQRLASIAAKLAAEWMPDIVAGNYGRIPQGPAEATLAPKMTPADAEITFALDVEEAYRRYRAATPRPGAVLIGSQVRMKVLEAAISPETGLAGTVLGVDALGLTVAFEGGSLLLKIVQPEGKKAMSANDYANGQRLKVGSGL